MTAIRGSQFPVSPLALKAVVEEQGVFCSLYTDRGSHFVTTPTAGGPADRQQRTQIGRALEQLGIELILASPQARPL